MFREAKLSSADHEIWVVWATAHTFKNLQLISWLKPLTWYVLISLHRKQCFESSGPPCQTEASGWTRLALSQGKKPTDLSTD